MRKIVQMSAMIAIAICFALDVQATDVIFGNCHYRELNGAYAGYRKTESYTTFETDDRITLVYCLRIPRATVSASALITPAKTDDITLNVRVVDCETMEVLYDGSKTQACNKNEATSIEIIPSMDFPKDTWYRVEIQAPNGHERISMLKELDFERTGNYPVCDAHLRGFPTPATHLWMGHSSAQGAPQNESYEWCYQECLMPEQWATINTYLMTLGITGGYMGMQMAGKTVQNENGLYTDTIRSAYTHQVLFSIWDNGDTDITPNLPDYLRAGALDYGSGVKINHFGNEGTGCQAMITNAKWNPGQWVQFLTCARPEETDVVLKDQNGNDSIVKYPNSLLSAWYKTTDDPVWHYIATIRHSGESHYWNSWYSFIENWADTGGELFRRAYYRNNYQRSVGSGKWYFINNASFSQTTYQDFVNSGEITTRQVRKDYGHGLASDVPRAYYMQAGGYGQPKDSTNVLPLVDDHSVVESINLDSLLATLNKGLINDGYTKVKGELTGVEDLEPVRAIVGNYVNKINRFGGYTAEEMAEVKALYDDENSSAYDIRRKMLSTSKKAMPLKYGSVNKLANICTFRNYQLRNDNGVVIARNGIVEALPADEVDITDPHNNWVIIRHDDESYYCVYNIGEGKYLCSNADGVFLSELPHKISITNSTKGLTLKDERYIGVTSDGKMKASLTTGSTAWFKFLDNYYMTPDPALCYELLEQTTSEAIANGIDEVFADPSFEQTDGSNLSDDIAGVNYYDLDGRRIGYALNKGTYIARILLKNGATMVRKITVK